MKKILNDLKNNEYLKISLIITLIIYLPSLYFNFFIFDDNHNIILNSRVNELTDLLLPWSKSKIPLSYNYWQIMNIFFGTESPAPFRFINILLHLFNGLIIYKLLSQDKTKNTIAAISTSIFLLHPVVVQSVVWLSSARELFATFFTLLATYLLTNNEINAKSLSKALILFAISITFKPISVAAPIILLIYIYKNKKEFFFPLLSATLIVNSLIFYAYYNEILKALNIFDYNFLKSLGVSAISLSYYIRNYFAPFFLEYNYNLTPTNAIDSYSSIKILINMAFILLPIIVIYFQKSKRKELSLSFFSFIILIAINTGIIPFNHQYISTVADRYLYLPSIALIFFIYYFLCQISPKNYLKLSIVILAPLMLLSMNEVSKWKTSSQRLYKSKFTNDLDLFSYINALIKDGMLEKAQKVSNTQFKSKSFSDELNIELSIFQESYKNTRSEDLIDVAHTKIEDVPTELYPLLANYSYHNNNFYMARLTYVYSQKSDFKYLLDFDMDKLLEREKRYNDKILKEVTLLPLMQKNKYLSKRIYNILRPIVSDKETYDLEISKQLNIK